MELETLIASISRSLSLITYYIRCQNSANLNAINTLLETPFKEILNLIFELDLINLNSNYLYPAIDLGDINKKVAVQVTSTNDLSKIRYTINRFNEYKLFNKYNRLKILIIEEKKGYRPKIQVDTEYFSIKDDVISVFELTRYIKDLSIEKVRRINQILLDVIGNNNINENIEYESNEVKTIINIIQTISIESDNEEVCDDDVPDPNHKINHRFAEYREYLIQIFADLYPVYYPIFKKVDDQQNIGTIQSKKISAYLKKESRRELIESQGSLIIAYDNIVNKIEELLKRHTIVNYDKNAIEFYIIMNIIKCNVFPNT